MARGMVSENIGNTLASFAGWAEQLGEALGRGVARGISNGISTNGNGILRRPGRPASVFTGPVPPEKQCKVEGCGRPSRSKGLCSAHYQAERRRQLARKS